ncbi:PGPGW domain-containing protein [Cellulomonas fimi]|nr:PGPGW domain-containing protein [Cellulomonas fimi]NNH07235.1 hypothetical protein [Cellulomonas fimi]
MTTNEATPAAGWSRRLGRVTAAVRGLPRPVRVIAVASVGGTVVLAGVAMLVLPGPGILAILAGLAILATEFVWARRMLERSKAAAKAGVDKGRDALQRRR